ncbi:glycosyltransferase [Rossellomorea sp. BNER]|uniref:glycosyltransferase n=1 Tax=Rossellomorea sp. BNER TaxID=2962031 RepID=UPI003AF26C5E|nr:glycosyltransferase [Rossellomorea sp. BNER]
MNRSVSIMITTTIGREQVLYWVVKHLCKDIPIPFHLYLYNDHANPLNTTLLKIINEEKRNDIKLVVYNDLGKLNTKKIGCGGARHFLFEQVKRNHDIVISLDDDMQLKPKWLENIMLAMDKFPKHCVFTGVVRRNDGSIQMAGSNFKIENKTLYRTENQKILPLSKYHITEWGPMGCLAFCRSALTEPCIIPPLYIRDDAAFYLLLRRFGINETVVVPESEAIHKPFPVPSSNLRLKEEMEKEVIYFKKVHGLTFGY